MSENSKIEWTDHTWTPIVGCDAVSPACASCYAALMAARLEAMGVDKYSGLATRQGNIGKWTGKITVWEPEIERPLSVKKPGKWFLTSMGDVFHPSVPFDVIDRLFAVMALAEHHTFYVLTKRPETAAKYLSDYSEIGLEGISRDAFAEGEAQAIWNRKTGEDPSMWLAVHYPLKNVIIGSTAEDQERADQRRPHMADIAARGWDTMVSYEPARGMVNWKGWEFLSWLIGGGESGQNARPMHPDWQRVARDWCDANGIPYLFKQWGSCLPGSMDGEGEHGEPAYIIDEEHSSIDCDDLGRGWEISAHGREFIRFNHKRTGRLLDGVEHNGFPEVRP